MNTPTAKRLIFVLISLLSISLSMVADTLMQQLFHVKDLMNQEKESEALGILRSIENECLSSDNDTIKVLFNESMGYLLFEEHKYEDCVPYFDRVPALYEAINIKSRNYLEAYMGLGMAHQRSGHKDKAESYYRQGLLRSMSTPLATEYQSSFYLNLGDLYKERGDSLLATECYKRIDAMQYDNLLAGNAEDLIEEGELNAIELRKSGDYEQAVAVYDRLIKRCQEILGVHNDRYVRLIYSKGLVLQYNLGRNKEALPLFEEVLSLKGTVGDCYDEILGSYERFLMIYASEKNNAVVDSMFPEALSYAETHGKQAQLYRLIGNGYYWAEQFSDAVPYYEQYLNFAPEENGLSFLEIPNMLSVSYIKTNEYVKAELLLNHLITTQAAILDENPKIEASVFHNYGRALMLSKKYFEALPYLERASELFSTSYGQSNPKTEEYIDECKKQL